MIISIFIVIKLIIFFAILFGFGRQLCFFCFQKIEKISVDFLSLGLGTIFYIFFANLLSYWFKPPKSFWMAAAILVILTFFFYYKNRRNEQVDGNLTNKEIKLLILVSLVIFCWSGVMAIRTLERDNYAPAHIPAAALFEQGNFPPKNPATPQSILAYHYAPDLYAAGLHTLTGLPLWLAYDLQTAVFSALIFLLAFVLIYKLISSFKVSFLASLLFILAGGFNFLLIIPFLETLVKKYLLNFDISHPFKLLPKIAEGEITNAVINQATFQIIALSLVIIFISLFFLWQYRQKQINGWKLTIFGGTIFGLLALSQETNFVVVFSVYLMSYIIYSIKQKKIYIGHLGFLIFAGFLAYFQGGVLSYLKSFIPIFSVTPKVITGGQTANVINIPDLIINAKSIILNFGLPLFIFPAACWKLRKKIPPFIIFIFCGIAVLAFIIPFIVNFLYPRELIRFFKLSSVMIYFIVCLYLAILYYQNNEDFRNRLWKKILIFFVIFNSLIFIFIYTIFPLGKISRTPSPLYAAYPAKPITKNELAARHWLWQNTTIDDWFFAVDLNEEPWTAINHRFIVLYGRFAPAHQSSLSLPAPDEKAETYRRLIKSCQAVDLENLSYSYIYVNNLWPAALEDGCLKNNKLELLFKTGTGDEFIRIYKIRKQ